MLSIQPLTHPKVLDTLNHFRDCLRPSTAPKRTTPMQLDVTSSPSSDFWMIPRSTMLLVGSGSCPDVIASVCKSQASFATYMHKSIYIHTVCIYMCISLHTHRCTHIHTCPPTYLRTCVHTYIQTYMCVFTRALLHVRVPP